MKAFLLRHGLFLAVRIGRYRESIVEREKRCIKRRLKGYWVYLCLLS